MEGNSYVDMFLTKGDEYILVIAFLVVFVLFWRYLLRPSTSGAVQPVVAGRESWFRVLSDRFYHPGHGWAKPDTQNILTVGMDDFSQMLLGPADRIDLPRVGARLAEGEVGWSMQLEGRRVPFLSPIEGEVVEVNERLKTEPGLASEHPYDDGWIAKVKTRRPQQIRRNLLSGSLARSWMDRAIDAVRAKSTPDLGLVYQDGGLPVKGFVKHLSPAQWDEVAAEFFLTN